MTVPSLCILSETFHPVVGGLETQARTLARGLVERGGEVTVVTRRVDPSHPARETVDGAEVRRVRPAGPGRLRKWGFLATCLAPLLRRRRRFDAVLVPGFRILGMAAIPVCRLLGKPCILQAESLGEMSGGYFSDGLEGVGLSTESSPFRAFLALRNALLRGADLFVAISSEVSRELTAHGVDTADIVAIPHSVDTATFRPADPDERVALRRRLGIPADATVGVYTGRLVDYKGLPTLVRAWRRLAADRDDLVLLLLGSGGLDIHNCEEELRDYVAEHGLQQSVRMPGSVDDVHEYLRAADVFCFPTENEAFGISLIEAMACGLPSVTTPVGGVADILEDGSQGLVVAPGDVDAVADALGRLATDDDLRRRLGREARRTAVERYSTDSVVDRYVEVLQELVGGADPAPGRRGAAGP